MVNSHPSDDLLLSYAAGTLANPVGLAVACHISQCKECRDKVASAENVAGSMFEELEVASMSEDALANMMSRLDELEKGSPEPETTESHTHIANVEIPAPLRRFIAQGLDNVKWSGWTSTKSFVLPIADERYKAELLRIPAGKLLPEHTHEGDEYTFVIQGAFEDQNGVYKEGDFVLADNSVEHKPRALPGKDCICFAVVDAPLKMTGTFGRMLNPFLR